VSAADGWHFAFSGRRILLVGGGAGDLRLPDRPALAGAVGTDPTAISGAEVRLRPALGRACHAYDLPEGFAPPPGTELVGLRALHGVVPEELFRAAGAALQKVEWLRTSGFCSRCGHATERHGSEEAMACPACGLLHFPRVSPAVIVLIERGREMLLARSPHFTPGVYSTVAGFVEPGESLEDAVHREIREEVGVEVREVRYFGSQPWPFPHSLMVGFTAAWASGDIRIDDDEIEDARWFTPEALPPALPTSFSIARTLVDDFLRRAAAGGA
jgi:NAD+ diphosphatase